MIAALCRWYLRLVGAYIDRCDCEFPQVTGSDDA